LKQAPQERTTQPTALYFPLEKPSQQRNNQRPSLLEIVIFHGI